MSLEWQSRTLLHGIHAYVGGQGDPVVLLPGWPETADAYAELFPYLSQHYEVWALDPPGLGDSAPSQSGYDGITISQILKEATQNVTSTPCHLVGHDVGTWIAYAWAAQFPESVKSVTLLDAGIFSPPLPIPPPEEADIKLWQFAFNRLPDLPEILTQGRERPLFNWLFEHKSEHPERITQAKRDRYVECYSRPGRMTCGFEYYRDATASAAQNAKFSEKKLEMPVLALGGQKGVGSKLKVAMQDLANNVQGGEIPDCGHYMMEEQPEVVAGRILDFYRNIE